MSSFLGDTLIVAILQMKKLKLKDKKLLAQGYPALSFTRPHFTSQWDCSSNGLELIDTGLKNTCSFSEIHFVSWLLKTAAVGNQIL